MTVNGLATGLHGYLSATLRPPPAGHGYGVSFYTSVWSMVASPIEGFQVGLPSTWIGPENDDFNTLLCPIGTFARDQAEYEIEHHLKPDWSIRMNNDFRDVFQTIEGGAGTWVSTQFPTTEPKYRINGVPDCYTNQIGSPGWGFGGMSALPDDVMGLAQLSNRLLIAPDGLPFDSHQPGSQFGVAWMALPFTDYDGWFWLQSESGEADGTSLEGNRNDPSSSHDGAAFMAPLGDYSGQLWRLEPDGAGHYWLQTMQMEPENCVLEGNLVAPGSSKGGASFMAPKGDFTGEKWSLVPAGDGYYRLQTIQSAVVGQCLDSNRMVAGAPLNGLTHMAPIADTPTQRWKLVPQVASGVPATGDSSWTLFLSTQNFSGPVAFFPPATWSRISKQNLPAVGRGLDARPAKASSGAMEFAVVPGFEAADGSTNYSRIPAITFPTEERNGQTITPLMQDVTVYSRLAIYAAVSEWFHGGSAPTGSFDSSGAAAPTVTSTNSIDFDQGSNGPLTGFEPIVHVVDLSSGRSCAWGLQWSDPPAGFSKGALPEYFENGAAVPATSVPASTGLPNATFTAATRGGPYSSPNSGAWATPGPASAPATVTLNDGTTVTYAWYRFVDQPALQNLSLDAQQKAELQRRVELVHANWPIDGTFLAPPTIGALASVDPALLVTPPAGMEVGYVPIVTNQA